MMKTIKIVVSLSLIGVLMYNVEWESMGAHIETMSAWAIAVAFFVFTIQFPISAWKWQKALELHELKQPFVFLQKVLCIGFFFNNFLPSSIGGDAYRVIKTVPTEGFKSRAVSAVLLERIIGLAALLFLGLIGGIITLLYEQIAVVSYYVTICLVGGVGFLVFLYLMKKGVFSKFEARIKKIEKLEILTHNLGHIRRNPKPLLEIIALSLVFQILAIIAIGALFDALGAGGDYAKYALIVAIVGVAGVLPISINGIGLIEGAFALSAIQLGMDYNQAIIVAFMMRILVLPLSLICGAIYLFDGKREKSAVETPL
ncbi:MAG: flippase-like domain-containing protein [Gammaproteobacteria bacterium]|nr:flippase-like domain-containing protein [Gammaproteobacteria bacterium]